MLQWLVSQMSSETQLAAFFARHRLLLAKERDEEISRSSLLLTNCAPKLLEQKGLAITGLGVVDAKIGLGGKTCKPSSLFTTFGDLTRVQFNRVGETRRL